MKQLFVLISSIFPSLFITAQDVWSKADISVTVVSLTGYANPNAPNTIVPPNNTAQQVVIKDNTLTKFNSQPKEIPSLFKCSITVHNENNDQAKETTLIVVLPAQVTTQAPSSSVSLHKISSTSPYTSYIQFNLGDMAAGQNITVEFIFTKSLLSNKVSAYIFSNTSDPNPLNNYKDASY